MNIPNRIHIADLNAFEISDIASLPIDQLATLQVDLEEYLYLAKLIKDRLDVALERRFSAQAAEARAASGKDTGTVRFQEGAAEIAADLPKRVSWDQEQLGQLVETIKAEGDDPTEYVDISIKVPERKYAAWPKHIRSAFEKARTVRIGKPSYKILMDWEAVQ